MSHQTEPGSSPPDGRKPVSGLVTAISIASAIAAFGIVAASRKGDPGVMWLAGGITLFSTILAIVLWFRSRNEQR
jgi:hypothetical protein